MLAATLERRLNPASQALANMNGLAEWVCLGLTGALGQWGLLDVAKPTKLKPKQAETKRKEG